MRVHAILADPALLEPAPWPDAAVAALGGRATTPPGGLWLGPRRIGADHDWALAGGDGRLTVLGCALREDFGRRTEPVLVFSRLAVAPALRRGEDAVSPAAALARLVALSGAQALLLHDAALAPGIDPAGLLALAHDGDRLARVRDALALAGLAAVEVAPLTLEPGVPAFHPALLNALACRAAALAADGDRRAGLTVDDGARVRAAARAALGARLRRGFAPALPLDADACARLAGAILDEVAERDLLDPA